MAKLKPIRSGNSPAAPDVRIAIEQVLDDSPRLAVALTPAERKVWLSVGADARRAECGGQFDPRVRLTLEGHELTRWRARREAWVRALLADDPRVESRC
jgi:hypothetical protein